MGHPLVERYRALAIERQMAEQARTEAEQQVTAARGLVQQLERVEQFFHTVADEKRAQLEGRVETLVDHGLKVVFGQQYSFRVRSELTGKQIKTRFYVLDQTSDGDLELNIVDAAGGGIADVVSFLLRVVMLMLRKPVQRRLLILDEPFRFVSAGHMGRTAELLRELSESLGLQIILVTHRPELVDAATQVVRVRKVGGESVAEVEMVG